MCVSTARELTVLKYFKKMDTLTNQLLNELQSHFPITSQPYKIIATNLNISEQEVIDRIRRLKKQHIIRRIGGIFDSRAMGYYSTLVTMRVPKAKLDQIATLINSYPEVTHNYARTHSFNLWFTITASTKLRVQQIIKEIKSKTGINEIYTLPAKRKFKITTEFIL